MVVIMSMIDGFEVFINLEYIPELCTERHTGWLNIAGSINKPQRIGTRYSAGVLAESAIFTI